MPQFKQMVFMSLSVQHFLHHGVGGTMGVDFSALSQRLRCCTRYSTRYSTRPSCTDVGGSDGNILLGVQLSFTVPDSFFPVSVSGLLLWDLLYLWSHSSPQDCRSIVTGVVWSTVVYSKALPCPSPWQYTYEENLILNQLINATILHQSYQHILICEGAYKHILHHIYILAI